MGVFASRDIPHVLCTSLVNATATARHLRLIGARRVACVITGGGGRAEEDLACAELVVAMARGEDASISRCVSRVENSAAASDIREGLAAGYLGLHADDIALAVEVDRFVQTLVAVAESDRVLVRSTPPGDG